MAAAPGAVLPVLSPVPVWMVRILWLIAGLSALFAVLIFIVPLDTYRMAGNCLEVAVPVFCMACCLYACRSVPGQVILPLAAFAFFSYALSNAFWYMYSVALGRPFVYTTVAEFGFLCFFLFFIAAFSIGFPDEGMPTSAALGLFLLFFSIPVSIVWAGGDHQPFRLALLMVRFFFIWQLVAVSIRHGVYRVPLLFAGISLGCLSSMLYGVREALFLNYTIPFIPGTGITTALTLYDFLSIVGPMFLCSFALIQLGLFSYLFGKHEPSSKQVT
jgi:hypothetical protein